MDGKLDPSFNTGAELRKLLRDPRQFEVGRGGVRFRKATGPTGLLTRAFRIVALTTFCVILAFLLLSYTNPTMEGDWESAAWLWLAIWMGMTAGLIFVVAKLRALLANAGGRSEAKSAGPYDSPEPLPRDCGTEDWFSEDIRFVVWTFFLSTICGAIISIGLIFLLMEFLPDSITSDRNAVEAIVRGGGTLLTIMIGQLIWRIAESRRDRLID